MKPSIANYFVGHGFKIATRAAAIGLASCVAFYCGRASVWSLLAMLIALPLGWIGGALILWPIFGSIGAKFNGAPWSEGDLVEILVGPHRGHVGRIYAVWCSRGQVRVEVDEQTAKDVKDVYFDNQVFRTSLTRILRFSFKRMLASLTLLAVGFGTTAIAYHQLVERSTRMGDAIGFSLLLLGGTLVGAGAFCPFSRTARGALTGFVLCLILGIPW
jgi:hypothetical protein